MQTKPDNNQPPKRKMEKRVETKEDGRLLIYYTFEVTDGQSSKTQTQTETEAAKK